MEWNNLSISQRAEVIAMAVKSGLRDINDIKDFYNNSVQDNEYKQGGYLKWKNKIERHKGIDINNDPTYDYKGFYKSNPNRAWDMLNRESDAHFTDEFKTSQHPSFSNESIYSGYKNKFNPKGITGGTWLSNGNYQLHQSQFDNNWDTDRTLDYFDWAEDPNNKPKLLDPTGATVLRTAVITPNKKFLAGGSIYEPREDTVLNRIKGFFGFDEGGYLDSENNYTPFYLTIKPKKYATGSFLGVNETDNSNKVKPKNNKVSDREVVNSYIDNVLYTMENPFNQGFKNGRYGVYYDTNSSGQRYANIGPGINEYSDMAKSLDFKKTYSKKELKPILYNSLLKNMNEITKDLRSMYGPASDTISLGNRMILLDIAHNVRPKGSSRKNMPSAWPSLVHGMMTGNPKKIKSNTNSGSKRRQDMRNDLLFKKKVTPTTVKNR